MTDRKRIVILGAGFGGLFCALKLADADVDIVLIDRNDYHTFQPLLYQVATGTLDAVTVGHPVRDLLHKHENISFHVDAVTGIDLEARQVQLAEMQPLTYDTLVLGLGASANDFGIPGVTQHAFPLYTLEDALRLRRHVLLAFEAADKHPELVGEGELTIAIVGGGPTGIETAGAMLELIESTLSRDYPALDTDKSQVVLIQRDPVLLPPFAPKLQTYTSETLAERGVILRLEQAVSEVTASGVVLATGETIAAHTVIWAGGMKSNPVVESLGVELERGRIPVGPDLTLAGHPEVYVVGDCAAITDAHGPDKHEHKDAEQEQPDRPLPQLASVAKQAGEHAAACIRLDLSGKPARPFRYADRGIMATIGHRAAVVQMPNGHSMTGTPAWAAWAGVHLALLSGAESRVTTLLDWSWSMFTHQHHARIVLDAHEED
jgi:NADH dehydrogenase